MARFRDNEHLLAVEPIYERGGLAIERVQRFDETVLLADTEQWSSWSFRIMLGGTRYVRYAEQSYVLAPSTVLMSSPLVEPVHSSTLAGTGSDLVVLHFSGQRWRRFVELHPGFRAHNADALEGSPPRPFLGLRIAPPQLVHIVRRMIVAREALHPLPLELDNHCRLLLQLLGELQFRGGARRTDRELSRRIQAAQSEIIRTLAERPSLHNVADGLNVSLRQLQRDFVAVTGLTPLRYRNLIRLSEANMLLAETALPIAEIAQQLGYPSLANFSAAFRQTYQCSPRQMRDSAGTGVGPSPLAPLPQLAAGEENHAPLLPALAPGEGAGG